MPRKFTQPFRFFELWFNSWRMSLKMHKNVGMWSFLIAFAFSIFLMLFDKEACRVATNYFIAAWKTLCMYIGDQYHRG